MYGCTVTTGENGIASLFGYESDSTKYSVSATNTYYYDTQSLPVNASATSATADEMKSLKSSLGDAFFQGDDYPVLQHSIRIGVTAEDRVYGEDAEEPSVTGNSSDGTVTFQYKTKDAEDSTYSETVPTDVGEYTVKVTVKETDHFKGGEATANFTITKANASVTTAPKAKTLTYNKEAQSLVTVGEADGGAINYALGVDDVNAPSAGYTADIPSKTDAGTYYVWYKVVGDENHNDSEPACIKVTIAPNKTDLNKAIEDANEYYTSIKDDTNYSAIASDLKTAIDAAKNVTDKNDATALEVSEALKDISVAKAEASRKVAEAKEAAAKAAQEAAENAKKAAESDAAKAAAAQKAAEVAQRAAEDAKAKAEADKKTAEEAKAKAEDAQKAAEEAQKAAEERAAEAEKNALAPLDQTVLAKTKGAKKKVTVRWKAVSGAKGYQIVVAKNKKGTKKAKTYTVKGASKVKKVVKKLKKGKYYVKVRAYKTYKGNTVYGKFSKVKRVKVR